MSCLLPILDPEILPATEDITHRAILVRGLFSRRVGLPDSHAIDNPHVRSLMRREDVLADEAVDDRKSCLFATCGKAGADLRGAVDLYLTPKGEKNRPTYLTSLSPNKNEQLATECAHANNTEARWNSFAKVAGAEFINDIACATRYFKKHDQAVLEPVAPLKHQILFDFFRERFSGIAPTLLSDEDKRILTAIHDKMSEWKPGDPYQSRERLHEAIFGQSLPRVWMGRHPPCPSWQEESRYLVDALHNEYHADRFGLKVVTTPGLRVPSRLCGPRLPISANFYVDEKEVSLPTTVYIDHLDLEFLVRLRRTEAFWDTLEVLEKPHPQGLIAALSNHMIVISEEFKKYLVDVKNQPVRTARAKIVTKQTDAGLAAITVCGMLLAAQKLPYLATALIALSSAAATRILVQHVVEGMFSSQSIEDPEFTKSIAQLERIGRRMIE